MVINLNENLLDEVVTMHHKSLKDDFLPQMGHDFLRAIYTGMLRSSLIFGLVEVEKRKVRGFLIGTSDSQKFFGSIIKNNLFSLVFYAAIRVITKPWLFLKILETFSYAEKDKGVSAELVVIAVDQNFQRKGIGKSLVVSLEKKFRAKMIKKYKVTVHSDKKAVGFYQKLGFRNIDQFKMYGKIWQIYEKNT